MKMFSSPDTIGTLQDQKFEHGLGVVPEVVIVHPVEMKLSSQNPKKPVSFIMEGTVDLKNNFRRRDFHPVVVDDKFITVRAAPGKKYRVTAWA